MYRAFLTACFVVFIVGFIASFVVLIVSSDSGVLFGALMTMMVGLAGALYILRELQDREWL